MPPAALANLMWGGREHPSYQHLSTAMRTLLSRGRPLLRKIILGKGDQRDLSTGLVGNSMLVAQPTTGQIQARMPPPQNQIADNIVVIFTTTRNDVRKAKELYVSRSQYMECANLRKRVCYAFADVQISEENATECLPENGVPEIFV